MRRPQLRPVVSVAALHGTSTTVRTVRLSLPGPGRGDQPKAGGWGSFALTQSTMTEPRCCRESLSPPITIATALARTNPTHPASASRRRGPPSPVRGGMGACHVRLSLRGDRSCGFIGAKHHPDRVEHAAKIAIDVGVPEPQDPQAALTQRGVSSCVVRHRPVSGMLPSVDLDDQVVPETGEVEDVARSRDLSAEMKSVAAPGPQMRPESRFLRRQGLAQSARLLVGHRVAARRTPPPMLRMVPPPRFGEGLALPASVAGQQSPLHAMEAQS